MKTTTKKGSKAYVLLILSVIAATILGVGPNGGSTSLNTLIEFPAQAVAGAAQCAPSCTGPGLVVGNASGTNGEEVIVDVSLDSSPVAVDAIGLELNYDASVLTYVSCEAGDLTSGWVVIDCAENTPGTITLGGFNPTPIAAGTSGSIARLRFQVNCGSCVDGDQSQIEPSNATDDVSGMTLCCGTFSYVGAGGGGCDALCTGPGVVVGDASGSNGNEIIVDVSLDSSPVDVDAIGLDLNYDTSVLTYVSCEAGDLTSGWVVIDCAENTPGTITLGGFNPSPIAAGTSGSIARLRFQVDCATCVAGDESPLEPTNATDDVASMTLCCGTFTYIEDGGGDCPVVCEGPGLRVGDASGAHGEEVWIDVDLFQSPGTVGAFAFDINYDTGVLNYQECQAGDLTSGWIAVDCVENTPGTLTIGGFNTTPISQGTSGSILRMRFLVDCASCFGGQESELVAANLIDDLTGFDTCCGTFTIAEDCPEICAGPGLRVVTDVTVGEGQPAYMWVDLENSPSEVAAFGLDVQYDPTVLDFVSCVAGNLTQGWIGLDCVENTPGVLTIGGFDTTALPAGTSGTLVQMNFVAHCPSCVGETSTQMVPSNLIDDIAGYNTCCATVTWSPCSPNGDVNADERLSPRDALCVFEIFMNGGNVTPDCDVDGDCEVIAADVDCNGILNTVDALHIFDRYLVLGAPLGCFASMPSPDFGINTSAEQSDRDPFEVPVDRGVELGDGMISIPVTMVAAEGKAAFGFEAHFDPSMLQFAGFEVKSVAREWLAIDANLFEPGRLIVGGFDSDGLTPEQVARGIKDGGSVEIAALRFRQLSDDASLAPVTWVGQLLESRDGDGGGDEEPKETPVLIKQLSLGYPYPNPISNRTSALVSVPTDGTHRVRVSIYDVKGRLVTRLMDQPMSGGVHTVNWDRRTNQGNLVSSGIYFMQMEVKSAGFMMTRKLVVVK